LPWPAALDPGWTSLRPQQLARDGHRSPLGHAGGPEGLQEAGSARLLAEPEDAVVAADHEARPEPEDFAHRGARLLEALRRHPRPLVYASTNKVYGGLHDVALIRGTDAYAPQDQRLARHGIDERQPLRFCTPYGCSKGAADQYVLDYAESFGLPTAVLRMSCIYGPRQLGTEDQGWVAHFARRAVAGEPVTIYGDGRQVRDILFIDDAVAAYLAAWRRIGDVSGQAFNLGGGPANAVSLLALLRHIEAELGRPVARRFAPWRPNDQRWFVADARRARAALGLAAPLGWREGVARMLRSFAEPRVAAA